MIVHAIQTVLSPEDSRPAQVFVKGIIAPFDSLGLFSYVYRDRPAATSSPCSATPWATVSDDFGFLETMFMGELEKERASSPRQLPT